MAGLTGCHAGMPKSGDRAMDFVPFCHWIEIEPSLGLLFWHNSQWQQVITVSRLDTAVGLDKFLTRGCDTACLTICNGPRRDVTKWH